MKTNFQKIVAAKAFLMANALTLTPDALKTLVDDAQKKVSAANEAAANEIDPAQRIAKQLIAKNEADALDEAMTVKRLFDGEMINSEKMSSENKALIRSWGFLTHDDIKTGSIADTLGSNRKSWFSRVF